MLKLYKIEFLSPSTQIRAYTLFGAICWAYRLMNGNMEDFFKGFIDRNTPFIISSPFPIAESKCGYSLVFPKPIIDISKEFVRDDNICNKVNRKPIKKAKYVSFSVFKEIAEGKIAEEKELGDTSKLSESGGVIVHTSDKACFEDKQGLSVRNILNRINMRSENLFTEEYFIFSDRWFMVKFYDESYIGLVNECFKLIEDFGLGANKNIGWGKVRIAALEGFEEETKYLDSKISNTADKFITLSPVLPKQSIDFNKSSYQVETYKSPVDTTFGEPFIWRKKVMYLKEGSVIAKDGNNGWIGQLKFVGADNKNLKVDAYQYGYEFPIRVEG